MENIIHYYLYTTKGLQALALTDRNDPNRCFRLDAEASSLNAFNYVYYAASKSPFSKTGDSSRRIGASLTGGFFFRRYLWALQRFSHTSSRRRPQIIGD